MWLAFGSPWATRGQDRHASAPLTSADVDELIKSWRPIRWGTGHPSSVRSSTSRFPGMPGSTKSAYQRVLEFEKQAARVLGEASQEIEDARASG